MTMTIFILGVLFGEIMMYAKLNRFNTITGLALLENLSVAKAIALAIGVGTILLNIEIVARVIYQHWLLISFPAIASQFWQGTIEMYQWPNTDSVYREN